MQILDINQKDYDQKRPVYEDIKIDTAFRKINARSIGFHVWRIQNDHVETLPKEQYGTFYDECAYVVYAASVAGTSCDKTTLSREIKTPGATIERNIHFWLGANIAPERSKAAAYKIIELDLHLDHKTTQFRESQGNEGIRFLSYFKDDGIVVHCGNDPTSTPAEPRLYQIAGNAPLRCVQQRTISWQCFNSGQIMLLQTAGIVFVWIGRVTASADRVFGIGAGRRLKERHSIGELAIVDDGYEQSMGIIQKDVWNGYLNLSKRFVKPMPLIPSAGETLLKLYQCDTVNGVFRVELVKTGALEQADLYGRDSIYIVDYFPRSIWIWIGRSSQKQNRAEAMRHVRGYVIKKGYPASTPVARVIDGLEPAEFVALFPAWTSADINGNNVKGTVSEKFDALTLIQRPRLAARIQLIDDGCGDITVYQIGLDEVKEIPTKFAKTFYSGHCYVVHYQVACSTEHTNGSLPNAIRNVLYLWCGLNAPPEHRTIGDAFLVELSDHLKRNVVQVRISEGMEPPHFLQIFKGALIVLNAQEACLEQQGVLDIRHYPTSFVLKVVGNTSYSCKAVQVSSKTLYYPEDCYILKAPDNEVWIWCGQYSTGDSREMAKSIASNLGEYNLVMESNETDEFFNSVGEKFLSQLKKTTVSGNIILPPAVGGQSVSQTWDRAAIALYHCLLLPDAGIPTLRQIFGFRQQDLRPDGIFLLDAGSIVYVWIGEQTTPEEKGQAWELAKQLITTHPVQRDPAMPVAIVRQGEEPITFVGFFDTWDNKYYQTCVLYENLRMEIDGAAAGRTGAPIPAARSSVRSDDGSGDDFDRYQKYPLDMLRCGGDATQLPASINPTRKEVHLTHDDFVTVFKMTYHEFEELPKWKQVELKKQRKLF